MSQDLGYHRLPAAAVDTPQLRARKLLFWGIHALDKALSLRLGRTSSIQDCDISTPMPSYPADPALHSWHEMSLCWIGFAKFQGRVFSELFTVSSLSLPPATRANRAQKLAGELREWREKHVKVGERFHCQISVHSFDYN